MGNITQRIDNRVIHVSPLHGHQQKIHPKVQNPTPVYQSRHISTKTGTRRTAHIHVRQTHVGTKRKYIQAKGTNQGKRRKKIDAKHPVESTDKRQENSNSNNSTLEEKLQYRLPISQVVLYQTFNLLDANQNGTICLKDLEAFFKNYFPDPVTYHELREMMVAFNDSYEITFTEFRKLMLMDETMFNNLLKLTTTEGHGWTPDVERKFQGVLKNNRYMSVAELGNNIERAKIVNLVREGGEDSLGSLKRNRSLDEPQFNLIEREYKELEEVFNVMDVGKKGYLSAKDLQATMKKIGIGSTDIDILTLMKLAGKKSIRDTISLCDFIRMYSLCQDASSINSVSSQATTLKAGPRPNAKSELNTVPIFGASILRNGATFATGKASPNPKVIRRTREHHSPIRSEYRTRIYR